MRNIILFSLVLFAGGVERAEVERHLRCERWVAPACEYASCTVTYRYCARYVWIDRAASADFMED
jgi:hypothetical protein